MKLDKRYFIETYGCEMNKSDSIDITLSLEASGYRRAENNETADIVVLNTCSVREHAEERVLGRLGYYRALKERRGDVKIIFAGCMAQEKADDIVKSFPEIDIVVGTYHHQDIPDALQHLDETGGPVVRVDTEQYKFSTYRGLRKEGYRAWVNIIKGCSNYCSYCIVPYVRGPEKSKSSGEIVAEVEDLAARGVVEIVLLGQNVNAYGSDSADIGFIELLERLNDVPGIRWIRFLTSHPKDFGTEIVRRIAALDRVCSHFHLPLQSGSDRILSLMNRKYDSRHYRSIIDAVRTYLPESSITTDIIVGFPSETAEDFKMTLSIIREIEFDDAFTYRYSQRPGTRAVLIQEQVPGETAAERLDELISVQRVLSYKKNRAEIGKEVTALVEKPSRKDTNEMLCSTSKNKMVVVETKKPAGTFVAVRLTGISGNTLRGAELQGTQHRR